MFRGVFVFPWTPRLSCQVQYRHNLTVYLYHWGKLEWFDKITKRIRISVYKESVPVHKRRISVQVLFSVQVLYNLLSFDLWDIGRRGLAEGNWQVMDQLSLCLSVGYYCTQSSTIWGKRIEVFGLAANMRNASIGMYKRWEWWCVTTVALEWGWKRDCHLWICVLWLLLQGRYNDVLSKTSACDVSIHLLRLFHLAALCLLISMCISSIDFVQCCICGTRRDATGLRLAAKACRKWKQMQQGSDWTTEDWN